MTNEDVKAAEDNMASMINNIVNQVESDTGMRVKFVSVEREWANGPNEVSGKFQVKFSLGTS